MRHITLTQLFVCLILFAVAASAQNADSSNLLKQLLDLPAPAATNELQKTVKAADRKPDFFNKNKIPPDDAPIEDLVAYWSHQSSSYQRLRYSVKPSEKTLARLLEFCAENPDRIVQFLSIFPAKPEVVEIVKRHYDSFGEKDAEDYRANRIKSWLFYNSNLYIDELVKKAEKVGDKDNYVTNQEDLLALAQVDWERAARILERLVAADKTQPVSAVLARWAYYVHAIEAGDEPDVSKYRRQLQDVVEDRSALPGARDLALDALSTGQAWDGRDDWYLTLLADETLHELKVNEQTMTGLTTLLLASPPDKYIQMMASLVEHKNPTIRRAAIENLLVYVNGEPSVEAVRALLPWLTNPNWVPDDPNGRAQVINAVSKVDLPETVPALINILNSEKKYLNHIAEALARYKDPRAVPALQAALADVRVMYHRNVLIAALDACGGIGDDEKMAAIEAYAEVFSTPETAKSFADSLYQQYDENNPNPISVAVNIGSYVARQPNPGDGVVTRAIEREKKLRRTKPAVAAALSLFMQSWQGRVIFNERLRRVREGEADLNTILITLAQREEIRRKNETDVFEMRAAGGGVARGIAPCLLEDGADIESLLRQTDADALIAALGCGRLLRIKLPVAEVGALLKNPNKTVALAAERYLEAEDSPQARTLILAQHSGEAVILGARQLFLTDPKNYVFNDVLRELLDSVSPRGYLNPSHPAMDKSEAALREEIKANPDLLAIYGILPNDDAGQQIIRVFKDKVVFTFYEDVARYRERALTAGEYEDFYRLVLDEKIDTTVPYSGYCGDCQPKEFVMFGKNGGRRVFFTVDSNEQSPMSKIVKRFESFNAGELKLQYRLADKIKGLEVLLADEKLTAKAVWKNGGDLRVLVEDLDKQAEIQKNLKAEFEAENKASVDDEEDENSAIKYEAQRKRLEESQYAHYFWRSIENGRLGGISTQPLEIPYLYDETQLPTTRGIEPAPRAWKVRAGNYEIRTSDDSADENGLLKTSRSQPPQMIKKGSYESPIVTGDGKWVIATKAESWSEPRNAVRINIQTGREFKINLPPADVFKPIAFIASQNKVLLYRAKGRNFYNSRANQDVDEEDEATAEVKPSVATTKDDKNPSPQTPEYYLLDAATGATQPVKGEFRPLEQTDYRPLQPTAASPDEFWAAIYDKKAKETAIGRYNTKTFTFQTIAKLPQIMLDSMSIWVDEKEAKVYFVYEGHVLSAPMTK